jgi:hypothetical protein
MRKRKGKDKMGEEYVEADEENGKNWQEATRLVKNRKAFPLADAT